MTRIRRKNLRPAKQAKSRLLMTLSAFVLVALVGFRLFLRAHHDYYPSTLLLITDGTLVTGERLTLDTSDSNSDNKNNAGNSPQKEQKAQVPPGEKPPKAEYVPQESKRALVDDKDNNNHFDKEQDEPEENEAVSKQYAVPYQDYPITSEVHEHEFRESLAVSANYSQTFCVPWDINSDEWWTHHPTWEEGAENDTHYCFQPIAHPLKRKTYEDLYQIQFQSKDCSNTLTKRMWNSGWGADMGNAVDGLKHALLHKRPVQIVEKDWHYANPGKVKPTKDNKNVPPACSRANMFCYFLPVSNCPKAPKGARGGILEDRKPYDVQRFLYDYATRRQTWLRRNVYFFVKKQNIIEPCTAIHVRRGDVIEHGSSSRRYFPIAQYVNATTESDKNIFLLTDDANAITEATTQFPELNWMYIDRPRYKANEGGWEKQLPSNNPEFEVTTLLSIFRLVRRCNKLIHTRSAFSNMLDSEMSMSGKMISRVAVDKGINKFSVKNKDTLGVSLAYDKPNSNAAEGGKPNGNNEENQKGNEEQPKDASDEKGGLDQGYPQDASNETPNDDAENEPGTSGKDSAEPYQDFPITSETHAHEFREVLPVNTIFNASFCMPWDVNSDGWWTHHPDWEEGAKNDTHYCFQPIEDHIKRNLFLELYQVQFHGDCSKTLTKRMINSGWGADMAMAMDALKHAKNVRYPVQIVEKAWHYADPASAKPTPENKNVPPACPRRNMFCYFLPISNCPKAPAGARGGVIEERPKGKWRRYYYQYLTRRQTWLRKAVYEFSKKQNVHGPCTAIHCRRGDVVLHTSGLKRQYHAIAEYINATDNVHKNIYLLTDDANAINEAKIEFPDYNWMYVDRPRYKASEGGWEKQIPSNNPTLEVIMLLSEFELARECDQLVHSRSGFATQLYDEMLSAGQNVDRIDLDQGKGRKVFSENNHETVDISARYDISKAKT